MPATTGAALSTLPPKVESSFTSAEPSFDGGPLEPAAELGTEPVPPLSHGPSRASPEDGRAEAGALGGGAAFCARGAAGASFGGGAATATSITSCVAGAASLADEHPMSAK